MIRLLQRLLDPAYLYAVDPGPLGRWQVIYITWALMLLSGAGAMLWQRSRTAGQKRAVWSSVFAVACSLGVLFLALRIVSPLSRYLPDYARFLLIDVWTARVWPLSVTALAVLALGAGLLARFRLPRIVQRHIDALTGALTREDALLPMWQQVMLGGVHLVGLAGLWHAAGVSMAWAIPSLLALSIVPLCGSPRRVRLETLAPLLPAYAGTVVFLLTRRLGVDLAEYQGFAFPDPWSPWFDLPVLVVSGLVVTLWSQIRLVTLRERASVRERVLPLLLCAAIALWLAGTVAVHRTHGVTASDPYSYVQMAIDLAETGSPLHDFGLAGLARELGLPTWPAVHIGYHPPFFGNRSPTMWSIGWPLLMVPFYWLGGLEFLYFAAPLMNALSLIVIWYVVNQVLHVEPRGTRWVVAALTCALVATSPEGSERILVPMADAAAQLCTMLTLWFLLRGQRERPVRYGLLAGASFGLAYLVRHPQLPLGVAALAAALPISRRLRRSWALLAAFGGAALLVAVPDLLYHRAVFGGWLHTESTEWFLISVDNVGRSFFAVVQQGLLRREELGFIAPAVLLGAWHLWHRHRRAALILGSGFLAVFVFHLCYAALRPRDLIAIIPVLYLCAAVGFVAAWRWGQQRHTLLAALGLICCATFLCARSYRALSMPWRDDVITFGHVSARQIEALDTLRTLTPRNAVVGSMLNSGAIELHAGRQAIHPAPWTRAQLIVWTDALLARERTLYILDDGEEMGVVLSHLRDRYLLQPIQTLDLPYFALGGGNLPKVATLYAVQERE